MAVQSAYECTATNRSSRSAKSQRFKSEFTKHPVKKATPWTTATRSVRNLLCATTTKNFHPEIGSGVRGLC